MADRTAASRSLPLLVVVIVLAAAMLRGPILAVAPVAGEIGDDLHVGAGVVGLLTTIPVLCFAACAPLAIAIIRRAGADVALSLTLTGVVIGSVLRSLDGIVLALIGTAVLGAFVTIGNVVLPIIIAREFSPRRAHTMTGVYTAALNVGTMTVTLGTAPFSDAVGWRWAIASWSVFALVALLAWVALRGVRAAFAPTPGTRPDADAPRVSVLRHGPTWLLAAAFCGQAFAFYAITAWLPTMLSAQGFDTTAAGAIASLFQVGGMIGSLLLPIVTLRSSILVGTLYVGIGWLAVPLGFLFAPSLWLAWCIVGGLAQGGGITIVFIMINAFGDDEHTTAGRSGVVQGFGYAVAATGPLVLGALHEATGAWTVPLLVELVAVLLFLGPGVAVARHLRAARPVS
ncbi:MFS transporter [Microbacterium terrisoli]|uniref:MFS transporter n=1 Tax=Microbacterium terrisoli TaxID=3242192 RepID=UPI0028042C5C|nr:MFS transporter [Microbacterium protaetiae]